MTRAFVFPGQGSQAVGMGKDLADTFSVARELFQEVDDALDQGLSGLMFEGPEDELTLTENAQPALMAVSLAVMRVLSSEGGFELSGNASHAAGRMRVGQGDKRPGGWKLQLSNNNCVDGALFNYACVQQSVLMRCPIMHARNILLSFTLVALTVTVH